MKDDGTANDIRPSSIAGTWYPGEPEILAQSIDEYLNNTTPEAVMGEIFGVIVPHAGHQYSGNVAAHAFNLIKNLSPEFVVIISPIHTPGPGHIVITGHRAYETPLGIIPVSHAHVSKIEEKLEGVHDIEIEHIRFDSEHSLEIELPFLQRSLAEPFSLIPIMVRDQSRKTIENLGHCLAAVMKNESVLFIASSDLSHFYPEEAAQKYDKEVLSEIETFNPQGVLKAEVEGRGFACGRGAIAATLWATKDLGANRAEILHHATSGQVTSDYSSVVGYGAAVIYRQSTT